MSFQPLNNPCPCESGRDYSICCGNTLNADLDFVANLADNNQYSTFFNNELSIAVTEINQNPALFPVRVDFLNDIVEFVKMSPYWYSESTFLDRQRIQGRCAISANVDWLTKHINQENWQVTPFIFHSAFCGSTLMIRALELLFDCLPLKEPEILGGLLDYALSADHSCAKEHAYQKIILGLLSRRFEDEQKAMVKANDLHNAYITPLLNCQPDFPVLIMYTGLNDFIFGCLKTDERKSWIADRFNYTCHYFANRFKLSHLDELGEHDHAKKAAAYWSFNMLLFIEVIEQASEQAPERIRTLDFNDMLRDPLSSVNACGQWMGLNKLTGINPQIELNWLMGQHAKDLNQDYSPEQRQQEIELLLTENKAVLHDAEILASNLLGDKYPVNGLPQKLY